MKFIVGLLCLAILTNLSFQIRLPDPPRANDLANHYGTNPSANVYGPVPPTLQPGQLMRRGVTSGIPITPINNFNQEIDPKAVVSGDLLNTAPDASKIITPPLAEPKLKIDTVYRHEAVIKTPVHLGDNIEEKSVQHMDRLTGKITTHVEKTRKPILGVLNTVREVETPHTTIMNLKTHRITSNDPPKLEKVGI